MRHNRFPAIPIFNLLILIHLASMTMTPAFGLSPDHPSDRCAAWQRTLLAHNDAVPNAAFMTYITEGMENSRQWVLAKISPALGEGAGAASATGATSVEATDFPGGIDASWSWGDVRATARFAPALTQRADAEWSGAAAYSIETNPPTPVMLRVGGGWIDWFHFNPVEFMVGDDVASEVARITVLDAETLLLESTGHPLRVILHAPGGSVARFENETGQYATVAFPGGSGTVHAAFAETRERALELAAPRPVFQEVEAHYEKLLSGARIDTPDDVMDAAFESALITNEYCWFEPLGWIEGVHHWVTLWHQQHVGMAHWLGQHDRSRMTILETAARVLPSGAIPHLQPTGRPRRDFGGANQYFAWQVLQYYQKTGDADLVRQVAPALRASLANTLEECDPDGNLLIGWGLQIGNQEDFVATPNDGTSPSAELLNIIESVRLAEELLGNAEEARRLADKKARVAALINDRLVNDVIERPVFWRDAHGIERLDGQYHSLIYPVLAGILAPELEYTSIRHLRDRLTGPEGETYVSNNFPDHLVDMWSTWGMQAGAAQQPWAAFVYNKMGMTDAVAPPLAWISTKVANDIQRGTWPEVANELRPGYFSPPAALFVQAVVEALFGLQLDMPSETLVVRPCFPSEWDRAELVLPEFTARFERSGDTVAYTVTSDRPLARAVRWPVPLGASVDATVNGHAADVHIDPGVAGATAVFHTEPQRETRITLRVTAGAEGAPGLPRSMALSEAIAAGDARAADALALADAYGRMGHATFARRTIFSDHPDGGRVPHDYLVLPDAEAAPGGAVEWTDTGVRVPVLLRNNTRMELTGSVVARGFGNTEATARVDIPPRSEDVVLFEWNAAEIRRAAPGEESLELLLPTGALARATVLVPPPAEPMYRLRAVALPDELLRSDADYLDWRAWYNGHGGLWKSPVSPLHDLAQLEEIRSPELPGVVFPGLADRMAVAGLGPGRGPVVIPVEPSAPVQKAYVLVCSFVNNHDVFSPVAEVELVHPEPESASLKIQIAQPRTVRRLFFPGDVDAYYPEGTVHRLATYDGPRPDRHGLLPLVGGDESDWPADVVKPPYFPDQPIWADSAAVSTPNAVFNVIEIAPQAPAPVEAIVVRALGADAVIGVVGVVVAESE